MTEAFPTLRRTPAALWRAARWFGRGLRRLARPFLYLLIVLVALHLIATLITGRMLARELQRMRADGYTPPLSQLIPTVPPGEKNAADIYQKAFDSLRLSQEDEDTLFGKDATWNAATIALARRVIAANADYLRFIEAASRLPHCAFPVQWDAAAAALFPHYAKLHQAGRMLSARATLFASDGRLDDALSDCATILRLADYIQRDPTLIGQLVGYALQNTAVDALQRAVSAGGPSPGACRQLHSQLAATDLVPPSLRAMRGETVLLGLPVFDLLRRRRGRSLADLLGPGDNLERAKWEARAWAAYGTLGRPLLNLDEITYLRAMVRYVDAFALPWPSSANSVKVIAAEVERRPMFLSLLTKMVTPVFGRVVWSRDMRIAALRAAQIALALKVYHSDRGRYPDSLSDLEQAGWKLPLDPFGGKPYRYQKEGAGFLVYSIGPDLNDDRGRPYDPEALRRPSAEQREKAQYDYDVAFRCAR